MRHSPVFALTSLSTSPARVAVQTACIKSWRDAGLEVRSFNHPTEIAWLGSRYAVELVPVDNTSIETFGRHYVPISTMLGWAAAQDAPALLVNSDIELRLTPAEMKRLCLLSDGGLCYFVRHNYDREKARATPEPYGIDAFLLHGREAALFPQSSTLSMGQPFWDYWLPYTMAVEGKPIFKVEFPAALHRNHPQQWSWKNWHLCALEFDRMTGVLGEDRSYASCQAMSRDIRQRIDRNVRSIPAKPCAIREWVERKFAYPGGKTFLELGAHNGSDTAWMAALPDVVIHAFEPDPRNHPPPLANVRLHRVAISDRDGETQFTLSGHGWGQEWTYSSSIKAPKNHLSRYPVTFGERIAVGTMTLDTFRQEQCLGVLDFVWADIQGAEGEMIRGGRETLARTKYLFTEYSDDEMYAGQITLREILELLPDFRVVELWPDDVLLENRRLV